MKLTVITNTRGVILATANLHPVLEGDMQVLGVGVVPAPGRQAYELEIPDELARLDESAQLLDVMALHHAYRLDISGPKPKLVPTSVKQTSD
jgi:hypothetical protein